MKFEITEDLIQCYTAEYFQFKTKDKLKSIDCSFEIAEIYEKMKSFEILHASEWKQLEQRYFVEIFMKNFTEAKYAELINARECDYCGITMDDIINLAEAGKLFKKNERGWCFEIDRKKPNLEYTNENCVAACYWCNNAKTDEFDDEEFRPIGRLIGETLRNRLKK